MASPISEIRIHRLRWSLVVGWLALIASLFYDPLSPYLTSPSAFWSPLRINLDQCISFQGDCLYQDAYPIGTTLFWNAVVPLSIFTLLVGGHSIWRRVCPLSFFSQIPRKLNLQRHHRRISRKTGKVRLELAKVSKESWLYRHHLYLQFGLLFLGLCGRLWILNANRLILGCFLLFIIGSAIVVGYVYGGKSWCHYICPMAPVQNIFGEPRGLLTKTAHEDDRQKITQSMCRSVTTEGKEKANCVACSSPCLDIDAERAYFDKIEQPQYRGVHYAYLGLVVGYFVYPYLYSGGWDYYFSGIWAVQGDSLASLFEPGLYLFERAIPLPKLVAVPLVLGLFTFSGYRLGKLSERWYRSYCRKNVPSLSKISAQHRVLSVVTFLAFNYFFVFGGRPLVMLLPPLFQYLWVVLLAVLSSLWLYRTWHRCPQLYLRESLASRLRKQLASLNLKVASFLEGRLLSDLNADEVYVLAKVIPGFTRDKRLRVYQSVLREGLEDGLMNSLNSLQLLQHMRQELEIAEDEHSSCLEKIGIDDPELLDPDRIQNREDWYRLESYRAVLKRALKEHRRRPARGLGADLLAIAGGRQSEASMPSLRLEDLSEAIPPAALESVQKGRQDYRITPKEEERILKSIETEIHTTE